MGIAKQLYQLQEVDQELESQEQALHQITRQLGENQTVLRAQAELKLANQHLEELQHRLHSAEWELDDISSKITALGEELYSGRVKNPKELANLQHELDSLKTRRGQREDEVLELMSQVEVTGNSKANQSSALKQLEAEWQSQQQQLSARAARLKATIADLGQKRQLVLAQIDPPSLELYQDLKKKKGHALAKVEQGICHGCRISLSITELQRAKTGNLVHCSSCNRILFLA